MMMITIEVEVSPTIVNKVGMEALKQRLQRTIELEELALLAQELDLKMKAAGVDFKSLTEQAREEAWEEYKATHLQKHLE